MRRRADGGRTSAPIGGTGTGGRCGTHEPGRLRVRLPWARGLAALLLVAVAALSAAPVQAQTTPIWSTNLTVGEPTPGQRGFDRPNGFGTLDNDVSFTIGTATSVTLSTLIVEMSGIGLQFESSVNIPHGTLDTLVLELAGVELPLASGTYAPSGKRVDWNSTWIAANASSLNPTNFETTLPNGGMVALCLRTSTQSCSGGTASSDATLSGLALKDGTTAIDLTPSTFVATTTSYTAAVANAVDEITIVPTANDDNATYEIQNSDGTALTDADSNADDFQVDLDVGANTIKVEVTAEDNTTETYQVTVTRAAASTDPVWSTTMTIGGESTSRGFSSIASPDVGSLADVNFSYNGGSYEVLIFAAHTGGVTFRTRSGGSSITNLVLEWANETLELDAATRSNSTFTWGETWLAANAPSLNAATFAATLPEDGTGTVCLRTTTQACPDTTVTASASNSAPVFADADTTREFNETIGSEVATASNIGAVVTATDTDNDTLEYTLEGTDAGKFEIVSSSGQIKTKANERYDYETDTSYSVTVKADDNKGGTDTIAVTLNVTNQDETPLAPAAPSVTPTAGATDSLDVNWASPDNIGRPVVRSYDLRYKLQGSNSWVDGPQGVSVTNATIGSLSVGTEYEVQVRATNDDGDGAWSMGTREFTLATIPQVTIAAAAATEGSAVVFTVTLSATTTADVTVPYSTSVESDDTATLSVSEPGGADFVNVSNAAITIQAGSTTGTISISTTRRHGR